MLNEEFNLKPHIDILQQSDMIHFNLESLHQFHELLSATSNQSNTKLQDIENYIDALTDGQLESSTLQDQLTNDRVFDKLKNHLNLRLTQESLVAGHRLDIEIAPKQAAEELNINIELDGQHHTLPYQIQKDRQRDDALKQKGWKIIHIANQALLGKNPEEQLTILKEKLIQLAPSLTPKNSEKKDKTAIGKGKGAKLEVENSSKGKGKGNGKGLSLIHI